MTILMSKKEQTLLENNLAKSVNYLEYGAGGSTILACSMSNIDKIRSVESDLAFINELSEKNLVVENLKSNRLKFYSANIGEIGRWGIPVNGEKMHFWPLYSLIPFTHFDNQTNYDLVLIDGRFRVACAIAVALENSNCVVLIHDYFKRPQYWILEKFYNVANRADTLVELHLKKGVNSQSLASMFSKFCYMPDDKRGLYNIKQIRKFLKQFRKNSFTKKQLH